MNNYESMIILAPELKEADIEKENQNIAKQIGKLKGTLVNSEYWGKRALAYMIDKKTEGHYVVNYLKLPPSEVPKLERFFVLAENILRYNLLRKESLPDRIENISGRKETKLEKKSEPERSDAEFAGQDEFEPESKEDVIDNSADLVPDYEEEETQDTGKQNEPDTETEAKTGQNPIDFAERS